MATVDHLILNMLGNAVWQLVLVAVTALICARALKSTAARYRHAVWVAALALGFGMAAATGSRFLPRETAPATTKQTTTQLPVSSTVLAREVESSLSKTSTPATASAALARPRNAETSIAIPGAVAATILAIYLIFLLYRGMQLFRAWRHTSRIVHEARETVLPERVQQVLARCEAALEVKGVRILASPTAAAPMTAGVFDPVIILPERLLEHTDEAALTSAIGHELAHVRRHDYIFNLAYELIYLPLSFHPAAAFVRRRIHQTRELRCDELVIEKLLDAEAYARSLVELAGSAVPRVHRASTITVAIDDADILEERVMSILQPKSKTQRNSLLLAAVMLLFALPCFAALPFTLHLGIAASQAVPQQAATATTVATRAPAPAVAPAIVAVVTVPPAHMQQEQQNQELKKTETTSEQNAQYKNKLYLYKTAADSESLTSQMQELEEKLEKIPMTEQNVLQRRALEEQLSAVQARLNYIASLKAMESTGTEPEVGWAIRERVNKLTDEQIAQAVSRGETEAQFRMLRPTPTILTDEQLAEAKIRQDGEGQFEGRLKPVMTRRTKLTDEQLAEV